MNINESIKKIEALLNKQGDFKTLVTENGISIRNEPLRGTLHIELGELVKGIVVLLVNITDKEPTDIFRAYVCLWINQILDSLNEIVAGPCVIVGDDYFKSCIREMPILKNMFAPLTELELKMIENQDFEITFGCKSKHQLLDTLLIQLQEFFIAFESFIKGRIVKELNTEYFYLPFQKRIVSCGETIHFDVFVLEPLTFKLVANNYECKNKMSNRIIQNLFEEFLDSMRLSWLIKDYLLPAANELASVHCRGKIIEDATYIQNIALQNDWGFDEIDLIFRVLSSNSFNNVLDGAQNKYLFETIVNINEIEVAFLKKGNTLNLKVYLNGNVFEISALNGFPFKTQEIEFKNTKNRLVS